LSNLLLPIHSDRLLIRHLEERDFEDLYALETDAKVKRYVGGPVLRARDECMSLMRLKLGSETCPLSIVMNEDASFVGRALLAKTRLTITSRPLWEIEWEIQVLIARKYWGQGFGQEVVNELIRCAFALPEITSVVAVVDPNNVASQKLMENIGFQYVDKKSSPGSWDDNHMVFRLTKP
jgi:RimJ/RimL family protein N-acetyltransferase